MPGADAAATGAEAQEHFYLHPGALFFSATPTLVTTILGPCVSVCLFDPKTSTGGMNHYLLPAHFGTRSMRFADVANAALLTSFEEVGVPPSRLQAKVFGGAMMRSVKSDLAERNIHAAFEFLAAHSISVVNSDVGGPQGRKLHFRTSDGAAWVRLL